MTKHAWLLVLGGAAAFLVWINSVRIERVGYVTELVGAETAVDPASPTGYAGGVRQMIVPEHNSESYQWIMQVQQMFERGEWRVRHVDYDNAPIGRDANTPSPYRWWLGFVAKCHQWLSGRSDGLAVERAALYADPILHGLLLVGAAGFAAWQFGALSAALLAIVLAIGFPFAGAFLPGQPDDDGLMLASIVWTILPLLILAGPRLRRLMESGDTAGARLLLKRGFSLSGIAGGIGLWVNAPREGLVLSGIVLGGIVAAWLRRSAKGSGSEAAEELPWRNWALCGAATSLAAFFFEFAPGHLGGLRLEQVHPLYSLGWVGAGELLTWIQRKEARLNRRGWVTVILATLAIAATPTLMFLTGGTALAGGDALATRLTNIPGSAVAANLSEWIKRDGASLMVAATVLPLLLLVPAGWFLARRRTPARHRTALLLAIGPVLAGLALACFQIRGLNFVDGTLFALMVALLLALTSISASARWIVAGVVTLLLLPGAVLVTTQVRTEQKKTTTEIDVQALIERDLAHWLANQTGEAGAVILAPPNLTASLCYFGGLSGIVTPYLENKTGFLAAVRISGATSPDEAQALAQGRNLTHIVVPSWDETLNEFALLGAEQSDQALISLLHQWQPPRWLRPVPYPLPQISGFEGRFAYVFQVVEVQDNQTALSRLAEYFLEMGMTRLADSVADALEQLFPSDLAALTARAHVEIALRDGPALAATLAVIDEALARGSDGVLPWERRVSLALALAEARRMDQARTMVTACLTGADVDQLRFLTTGTLYRLMLFCKVTGTEFPNPQQRNAALALLPLELRERL